MTDKAALAEVFAGTDMPPPASREQAERGCERWLSALADADECARLDHADALAHDPAARSLLDAVFGGSPFLAWMAEREPAFLIDLLCQGPDAAFAAILADAETARQQALAHVDPGRALRIGKRRLALATGFADVAGVWSLERVTEALSDFAEAALDAALAGSLVEAALRGIVTLADAQAPERHCGLIILGVGKLGGRELNYSSDIDLIIFYDPERFPSRDRDDQQRDAIRIVRAMGKRISEHNRDGYVFRVDYRLRPDPGATPVAVSVPAAEEYYETLGQNWERAALIKARPVAGDREAADAFIDRLQPFIWRKHLDFAAIQDIHSIKRQIDAHRGGGRISIAGHNLKLGRGGIREIEFFAQTQQLIWGGRLPALRLRGTIPALEALERAGKIGKDVVTDLAEAYRFLRRVEHRLQMINDEQTHTVPTEPERLTTLARFLGFADVEGFGAALQNRLRRVENHYALLFEDAPDLISPDTLGGNLVFTGGDPDPETLATLARLGFTNPPLVDAAVRAWHRGRCRAMRSTRARELLTELTPELLKALSEKPDPDAAFVNFDRFLNGLPAGVQLFSMLHANPSLLVLITDLLGVAPALAEHLARRPSVLESVLSSPDFFSPPPSLAVLTDELEAALADARDMEDVLDASRRWANDRKFQVGTLLLTGAIDIGAATAGWTHIAEAALICLLPRIEDDFAQTHGHVAGCGMAVVGMGKLGGREMTATSDLDLIFVYGNAEAGSPSDGRRPLPAPHYFARLSQRLINAIAALTAEGRLYEVDMRLRPSGKAGPIAVSIQSFDRYQRFDAWVWEQMALTRARVVAGPASLQAQIEASIRASLSRPRNDDELVVEVADMRARMAEELGSRSLWEVKHLRGGLVDIEFLAQFLQLRHAHRYPEVLSTNTRDALARLCTVGVLDGAACRDLSDALDLWQSVQNRIRLYIGESVQAEGAADAPKALRVAVEGVRGLAFEALVATMQQAAERVHALFRAWVEQPAVMVRSRLTDE